MLTGILACAISDVCIKTTYIESINYLAKSTVELSCAKQWITVVSSCYVVINASTTRPWETHECNAINLLWCISYFVAVAILLHFSSDSYFHFSSFFTSFDSSHGTAVNAVNRSSSFAANSCFSQLQSQEWVLFTSLASTVLWCCSERRR